MNKKTFISAVVAVLFLAGISYAQDTTDQSNPVQDQGSGGEHSHRAPSQAAIDACSGKSAGDDCEFTTPRGKDISGTCSQTKDGQTLFCKRARKTPSQD